MSGLDGTPLGNTYSPLYPRHSKLIKQNDIIKYMVFSTYDSVCQRQLDQFLELFESMLTSTFSNPWVFLKGATKDKDESDDLEDAVLPSFDDTKERIPKEIDTRCSVETIISAWLHEIPTD